MVDKPSRRELLEAAGITSAGLLAGCTSGESSDGSAGDGEANSSTETTSGDSTASSPAANVGLVLGVGGLGDQGFNDLAHAGLQRAEEELGISFDMAQPDDQTQFEQYQSRFADSSSPDYDLICCIGYTQASTLSDVSQQYPDQQFVIVDDSSVDQPNVASYTFEEHKGAYLVGTAAALLTTQDFSAGGGSTAGDTTALGFVGGQDSYLINKFRAGYAAGARDVDDDIEVLASYVGSFSDPSTAKESAKGMFSNGADIVYPAAGGSGVGVFQAAQEDGNFAFGSDTQKSLTQPDFADIILGSMLKQTDNAIYESVQSVVDDSFPAGENVSLGLESDGVSLAWGDELGVDIPESVADTVEEKRQAIVAGDIEVPSEPES